MTVGRLTAVSLGLSVLLACSSPADAPDQPPDNQPPAFSVRTRVTTRPNTGGCLVFWDAIPSNRLVPVTYRVGVVKPPNGSAAGTFYVKSGTFSDSTRQSWDQRIDLTFGVYWEVAAGTWADSGRVVVQNCA